MNMVYSFQLRFEPLIREGKKLSTIRGLRKDGKVPRPGDTLHLFVGMRTKTCSRIQDVKCERVSRIMIDVPIIKLDGRALNEVEADYIARRDGFRDAMQLFDWFMENHTMPFTGHLIEWAGPSTSLCSSAFSAVKKQEPK